MSWIDRLGRGAQARQEAYHCFRPEPVVFAGIRQATNDGFVLGAVRA